MCAGAGFDKCDAVTSTCCCTAPAGTPSSMRGFGASRPQDQQLSPSSTGAPDQLRAAALHRHPTEVLKRSSWPKASAAPTGTKYVNGVLDKTAAALRGVEVEAAPAAAAETRRAKARCRGVEW
jgi:hypothetical protein